jgi:hypothetical protein
VIKWSSSDWNNVWILINDSVLATTSSHGEIFDNSGSRLKSQNFKVTSGKIWPNMGATAGKWERIQELKGVERGGGRGQDKGGEGKGKG